MERCSAHVVTIVHNAFDDLLFGWDTLLVSQVVFIGLLFYKKSVDQIHLLVHVVIPFIQIAL